MGLSLQKEISEDCAETGMVPESNGALGNTRDSVLSARGRHLAAFEDFLVDSFYKARADPYHHDDNPKGIVNMGTAVNKLMEPELTKRLNQGDCLKFSPDIQHYFDFCGIDELKEALTHFFARHLKPIKPIVSQDLIIMNGVSSCLDAMGHVLCDPGDVVITPTPIYARIFTDVHDAAQVNVEPLPLSEKEDESGRTFVLRADLLEEKIISLKEAGKNVKGFILVNPNNPLGDVYSAELLKDLLQVCARHKVHFVSDEIYALSVFDDVTKFTSILSLDLPDPSRTHFLWGFSKDFGLASMRVGVIYSLSKEVVEALVPLAVYKNTSQLGQIASTAIVNDTVWCDEFFLPTNSRRLKQAYERARERLQSMGATVRIAEAGLFIWFGVHSFLKNQTEEEELELQREALDAGLYIVPGTKMYCEDPGWFRIIISVSQTELEAGLDRLEMVLTARRVKLLALENQQTQ